MSKCTVAHPDQPTVVCSLPAGLHPSHLNGKHAWPHEEWVDPLPPVSKKDGQGRLLKIKDGMKNVRTDDPPTARAAAERYEPKRETAKGRVLAHLRAHPNEWVDAPEFTHEEIGGFAGTRRLRELREDDGWPIETRPKPGYTNLWQHRLIVGAEEVSAATLSD